MSYKYCPICVNFHLQVLNSHFHSAASDFCLNWQFVTYSNSLLQQPVLNGQFYSFPCVAVVDKINCMYDLRNTMHWVTFFHISCILTPSSVDKKIKYQRINNFWIPSKTKLKSHYPVWIRQTQLKANTLSQT